jgi:hypothetical protein
MINAVSLKRLRQTRQVTQMTLGAEMSADKEQKIRQTTTYLVQQNRTRLLKLTADFECGGGSHKKRNSE